RKVLASVGGCLDAPDLVLGGVRRQPDEQVDAPADWPQEARQYQRSHDQRRDRREQELAKEENQQQQDDRRDVDAAEIGQQAADGPQTRLRASEQDAAESF